MCTCNRRHFIKGVAAVPLLLGGCMQQKEGAEAINFGREACTMCGMIISDPHFAAEIRGGPQNKLVKFDDMGCSLNWLNRQDWKDTALKEYWVMDSDTATDWLDAHKARYLAGAITPMDYGYAGVKANHEGAVDFETMRKAVLAKGLSNLCLQPAEKSHA